MSQTSRTQQIRKSLSDLGRTTTMIFEAKRAPWPEPEKSIGRPCSQKIRGTHCWEVVGPALDLMEELSPSIKQLLEDNQELLEQGEDRPRVVAFNMWMEGSKPSSAEPIIVFSSKSRRQRSCAKALLKQSDLLVEHPGIRIRTLDTMPAIYKAANEGPSMNTASKDDTKVYVFGHYRKSCGEVISFGNSKFATLTCTLVIDGVLYGMSAQHARFDFLQEPQSPTSVDDVLAFDDESEDEDGSMATVTSRASVSTSSPVGIDTSPSRSSEDDDIFDKPREPIATIASKTTTSTLDWSKARNTVSNSTHASFFGLGPRRQFGTLLPCGKATDLDYELFILEDQHHNVRHSILRPAANGECAKTLYPCRIATDVIEGPILAATGPTGVVMGMIIKNSRYIRMQLATTYQEMWTVQLDRHTVAGDCGSLVVNATTGDIYGHIVAGEPISGLAYIIPAYKVVNDINIKFGAWPLLAEQKSSQHSPLSRSQRKAQIGLLGKDHFETTVQNATRGSRNTFKGIMQKPPHSDHSRTQYHPAARPGFYIDTSTPLHTRSSSFRPSSPPHIMDHGSDLSPDSPSPPLSSLPVPVISPVVGALDDNVNEKDSMRLLLSRFPGPPPPRSDRWTSTTQPRNTRGSFAPAAPWSLRSTSTSRDKETCHISRPPHYSGLCSGTSHSNLSSKLETESCFSQNPGRLDNHAASTAASEYSAPSGLAPYSFADKQVKGFARDSAMRDIEERILRFRIS